MAETLDRRVIIVELETAGGVKRLEGLAVEYTATKTSSAVMNEAEIKIANLAREDRDYILSTVSPLNRPRQRKTVAVWAWYEQAGVTRWFFGDITAASVSQPPDIWLTVKAKTGYFARGDLMARSEPPQARLSEIAEHVAGDIGLTLDFQATDKNVANYAFTGGGSLQVDKLQEAGLVDAYIDDDRLVILDRGRGLSGRTRKLSEETGMIGVPEVDERGVKVKMLMDPHTTIGTALEIESRLNPAANGRFVVYKMRDNCALRNTQFYIEAEALRPGMGGLTV